MQEFDVFYEREDIRNVSDTGKRHLYLFIFYFILFYFKRDTESLWYKDISVKNKSRR